jgi:hypothetical protein
MAEPQPARQGRKYGGLPVTPEAEAELKDACRAVTDMRDALMAALNDGGQPMILHVNIHELRGFVSDDLAGAFKRPKPSPHKPNVKTTCSA